MQINRFRVIEMIRKCNELCADTTIHLLLICPTEQKLVAYRFLFSLPLMPHRDNQKWTHIANSTKQWTSH
jgi:hypothetical protein